MSWKFGAVELPKLIGGLFDIVSNTEPLPRQIPAISLTRRKLGGGAGLVTIDNPVFQKSRKVHIFFSLRPTEASGSAGASRSAVFP